MSANILLKVNRTIKKDYRNEEMEMKREEKKSDSSRYNNIYCELAAPNYLNTNVWKR